MRLAVWLAGLLLFGSIGVAEGAIQVEVDGDRVTLMAEQAPLQDILRAVAAAGHFTLHLNTSLTDPTSVQFRRRPLLDSLDWLLREHSSLIGYARERGDEIRVEEVWVIAPSVPAGRSDTVRLAEGPPSGTPLASADQGSVERQAAPEAEVAERIGAALALVEGDQAETGSDVLVDLLRTHAEPGVREVALAVLPQFETLPLGPVAGAALADPEASVRLLALTLLGEMARADPGAKEILEEIARDGVAWQEQDGDIDSRRVAAAYLGGTEARLHSLECGKTMPQAGS